MTILKEKLEKADRIEAFLILAILSIMSLLLVWLQADNGVGLAILAIHIVVFQGCFKTSYYYLLPASMGFCGNLAGLILYAIYLENAHGSFTWSMFSFDSAYAIGGGIIGVACGALLGFHEIKKR